MQYNPSETNLPKWTQQLLDELRAENIRLREKASAALAAHIVKLDCHYAGLCVASLQASDLPRLQCAGHNLSQAPPSDH